MIKSTGWLERPGRKITPSLSQVCRVLVRPAENWSGLLMFVEYFKNQCVFNSMQISLSHSSMKPGTNLWSGWKNQRNLWTQILKLQMTLTK